MQLANFDNTCESIETICSKVNHQLRYEKTFPPVKRKEFDLALTNLIHLLQQDRFYLFHQNPLWHTAYRIVRLTKLSQKMEKILQNIYAFTGPKYFSHKLKRKILPSLANRIYNLNMSAFSNHRLPFNPGTAYAQFFDKAQKQISVIEASNINSIERDFFHLLGNHLRRDQLAQIDLKALTGSWEIYSLLSLGNVLNVAIQEEKIDQDKKVYQFLQDRIKEAFVLATKLSFVAPYAKTGKMKMNFPDKAYYEAIVSLYADQSIHLNPPKKDAQTFLEQYTIFSKQYTLDNVSAVPIKVVENDMAWDMVQTISQMKAGEVKIFLFGNTSHRLTIQITCTADGSPNQKPMFKYEIFNTGDGIIPFHNTVKLGFDLFAHPLTYLNVPLSAFTFFFCAELITHSWLSRSMQDFYGKHDFYLTKIGGVTKNIYLGKLYRAQTYGTCCYTGLEAWIDSNLTLEQIKKLELIKTRISTEKQSQIVTLLESDILKSGKEGAIVQRPLNFSPIVFTDKQKKLKESRRLLALGREHLSHLKEEIKYSTS